MCGLAFPPWPNMLIAWIVMNMPDRLGSWVLPTWASSLLISPMLRNRCIILDRQDLTSAIAGENAEIACRKQFVGVETRVRCPAGSRGESEARSNKRPTAARRAPAPLAFGRWAGGEGEGTLAREQIISIYLPSLPLCRPLGGLA